MKNKESDDFQAEIEKRRVSKASPFFSTHFSKRNNIFYLIYISLHIFENTSQFNVSPEKW
ncbi:hypothetical protein [Gottfriedia luciferensis]|uniref:hypothetical protein n=1 Tax=Gottfriedia luciferensis TaxID=178774 RepID=UPI001302D27E|nr:hypothetical protein [Gottfriedia luciferensis]